MKTLKIIVSSNGWEYAHVVTLTYKHSYETKITEPKWPKNDSNGNPAPDQVVLDGEYVITFDEAFEVAPARQYKL
jgi:hypothetical protein